MAKLSAYINFKNNCREAMAFYQEILGGELQLMSVKESPMKEMFPAEAQDGILHADLTGEGFTIQGTDMTDPNVAGLLGIVSLTLSFADKAEVHEKFDKLSEGGKVAHPVMTFLPAQWVT
ncbi:VOC family protein [Mucilaginibacter litoreus]|uniref:VOC family protein n=1 Tax=Mucilaginibacter litoreus TaxID=1048221 RepID=A0ABW3AWM5_9SPHI